MSNNWNEVKLKYVCKLKTGNSINADDKDNKFSKKLDEYYPYVATKDIDVDNQLINYDNGLYIPIDNGFSIARKNSILLCIEGGSAGRKIGYLDKDVCFVNKLCNFQPDSNINSKFLFYSLQSYYFSEQFTLNLTGIIPGVSVEKIKNLFIMVPSFGSQQKIANFLDEKTAQIDSVIENTKQSIEELKRYKQSLIIEIITKGLDSKVEMKKSGVEWIEKIPTHWSVNYLNQYFKQHKLKNEDLQEKNLLSLSYGKIVRKNINTTDGLLPENFGNYNIIDDGDIVLRLTDLQNDKKSLRVGLATEKGIITSAYVTIRKTNNINTNYIYYFLHSFDICKGFYGLGSGVRQGLTYDGLKRLKIIYPPIVEQEEIVKYLNEKTLEIDKLIAKKEKLLTEMEKYKKSLIYEYVTGKKEVI